MFAKIGRGANTRKKGWSKFIYIFLKHSLRLCSLFLFFTHGKIWHLRRQRFSCLLVVLSFFGIYSGENALFTKSAKKWSCFSFQGVPDPKVENSTFLTLPSEGCLFYPKNVFEVRKT